VGAAERAKLRAAKNTKEALRKTARNPLGRAGGQSIDLSAVNPAMIGEALQADQQGISAKAEVEE